MIIMVTELNLFINQKFYSILTNHKKNILLKKGEKKFSKLINDFFLIQFKIYSKKSIYKIIYDVHMCVYDCCIKKTNNMNMNLNIKM